MRSFRIALLAILLTGSCSTSAPPTLVVSNVGEYFEMAVITMFGTVEKCYITTPTINNITLIPDDPNHPIDEKFERLESTDLVGCRVKVLNTDENDNGIWTLNAVTETMGSITNSYHVTVNPLEGPETTTTEEETENIDYLDPIHFDTRLGATHEVKIPAVDFVTTETCYIETPARIRYDLKNQDIPGLEVIHNPYHTACGVILDSIKESHIGQWYLISKERRLDYKTYERRQPFLINVTEEVKAYSTEITVVEGKNFLIRLRNDISHPDTCKLLGPDENEVQNSEVDPQFVNNCGFIVKEVNKAQNGTWKIEYGQGITFVAFVQVIVLPNGTQGQEDNQSFTWIRDQPVQQNFGPDDAIYCKVLDPKNFVIFEGFGRCNISLPRANYEHEGVWKMFVGVKGRVLTEESTFTVKIENESPKALVDTKVTVNKPIVTLSCSVSSSHPLQACKFRDPTGRILMANRDVSEDRYTFYGHGSQVNESIESNVNGHVCGIQITNPLVRDLGFWRCAMETTEETYFGFLRAWCPFATKDPEVAALVLADPYLRADRTSLDVIEGDNVLMSCSIPSAIRYCYIRAPNSTVFTVGPGFSSSDMAEYAGAGLDAGECSIRFRSLTEAGTGHWSCNVGFLELQKPEQQANIEVRVSDLMVVTRTGDRITARVTGRQLDYCRFVRSDGFGFSSHSILSQYIVEKAWLEIGECTLSILEPEPMDRHPWTVVAKIKGQNREISRTTDGIPLPRPPLPGAHQRLQTIWLVFLVSGIIMIILGILVGSKNNRNWTYTRAASIRESFRQRFVKKAAVDANVSNNNTARAA